MSLKERLDRMRINRLAEILNARDYFSPTQQINRKIEELKLESRNYEACTDAVLAELNSRKAIKYVYASVNALDTDYRRHSRDQIESETALHPVFLLVTTEELLAMYQDARKPVETEE